jgi:hypothetical protein
MEPQYTRTFLQNYKLEDVMRNKAIDESVKLLTQIILDAASGVYQASHHTNWKRVGPHKVMIPEETLKAKIYMSNGNGTTKAYPEIIPEVIAKLIERFPDVDFRQDELCSYLLVDWS